MLNAYWAKACQSCHIFSSLLLLILFSIPPLKNLGFSLGKLNYLIRSLAHKGLIKINNFKNNPDKSGYLYLLTPKGMSEKTKITIQFMKRKVEEYEELKKELEKK